MRKLIYGLGLAILLVILAGTAAVALLANKQHQLDSRSQAFADPTGPVIVQNWDERALTRHA
ncbi:MAG TPA: hypothetical protein VKB67_13335 [Rhizomicrobium sp.]|nr:hypothetical protein [Rhizomicrobium sp.]